MGGDSSSSVYNLYGGQAWQQQHTSSYSYHIAWQEWAVVSVGYWRGYSPERHACGTRLRSEPFQHV